MQILEKFRDKKIAVLGYGVEGMATLKYLSEHNIRADVLDIKDGQDYLERVSDYEIVFRAPGISPLTPELISAQKSGTVITSQIEEFFELCPAKIIGITGTKGKGTTSTLIHDILRKDGQRVFLGGNIGIPAISFLDEVKEDDLVVLELSSFQLQTLRKSPHIAVVLNVTSEHLDYHRDVNEYRSAKQNIVKHQGADDFAVINDDYEPAREFAKLTVARKYFFSRLRETEGCYVNKKDEIVLNVEGEVVALGSYKDLKLRGRHNLENVTAAALASYLAGAEVEVISSVIKEFKGLEHRLELVRDINGVKYYNDSFSTTPETAIAAIDSFKEPIVLIAGGSNKNSDYTELGEKIADSQVKTIILIGEMAENIKSKIPSRFNGEIILGLSKMNEIVTRASGIAKTGDVVLLSPACASFGLFENYKDRGNQFKDFVNKL